eukprot:9469282-Ditylum_brightwellii.AAC.1
MATIQDKWSQIALKQECKKRFQWKTKDFNNIDWDETSRVFCGSDFYHRRFITRYTYERLPLRGEKHSARINKICPCYEADQESNTHFMECTENKEQWSGLVQNLQPILNDYGIDPVLGILIYAGVNNQDIWFAENVLI